MDLRAAGNAPPVTARTQARSWFEHSEAMIRSAARRWARRARSNGWRPRRAAPVGTVKIVDPNPNNWLWITYNVVEEPVRVDTDGTVEPAAMRRYRWVDDVTLELTMRDGERFPDGEALTAATFKRSFEEQLRWRAPHPPGTHFNIDRRTRCDVADDRTVRLHLPAPDGLLPGKLRATHVMSTRFWEELGFGYLRHLSGEGHW